MLNLYLLHKALHYCDNTGEKEWEENMGERGGRGGSSPIPAKLYHENNNNKKWQVKTKKHKELDLSCFTRLLSKTGTLPKGLLLHKILVSHLTCTNQV